MAAMKPRTGDGPLEVTKEGRGIVMRVPLEGGGRLVVEMSADEAAPWATRSSRSSASRIRPGPPAPESGIRQARGRRIVRGGPSSERATGTARPSARRSRPRRTRDTARSRPARPSPRARAGSAHSAFTASARPASNSSRRHRVVVAPAAPVSPVRDDLRDAADGAGHHRGLAGHRLQVHDAQRLVHRRADEHGRVREQLRDLGAGQHVRRNQTTPVPLRLQLGDGRRGLGGDLRGVRRAGAQHQLDVRVEVVRPRASRCADALLPGDPADERRDTARPGRCPYRVEQRRRRRSGA